MPHTPHLLGHGRWFGGQAFGNCPQGPFERHQRQPDLRGRHSDPLTGGGNATCGQPFGNVADTENQGREDIVRELLTIEEVAERLRVKVLTIRWLRQEGRFPPAIKVGRRLVWDAADLEAWLETQRESEDVR